MSKPLEDYALLGDTQSAALVAKDGALDWLCLPRFDSDACFAALLGSEEEGTWRISPRGEVKATRRCYRDQSLVLETEWDTEEGTVRLVDFMPPRSQTPDVVRVVQGVRGRVPVDMLLRPRFGYGRIRPWVRQHGQTEVIAIAGPEVLALHTRAPVTVTGADVVGHYQVEAGDTLCFVLSWGLSHEAPPRPVNAVLAMEETESWWREWMSQCCYEGLEPEAVNRSLVTLKALTFMPTGGIVAAPTTSLPEELGGIRNWDYRYCWLRDAAFTLQALTATGFRREAQAWRDWMLRAVAGAPSQVQIMYGCAGERRLTEQILPWLPGYEGSRPVRIGNAAVDQLQLDIYGEAMDAFYHADSQGLQAGQIGWRLERGIMDYLEGHWFQPDEGIWEVRGPQQHFTHSRVMAWVAVDRAVRTAREYGFEAPLDRWRALAQTIHAEVLEKGFDAQKNTFVQAYGSKAIDASLLLIPLVGFLPAHDPRMVGTVTAVERELLDGALVRRYRNSQNLEGLPGQEGAFLACSFWLVDNYVLQGRGRDAQALFDRLLSLRNDVGLLAEQYDTGRRRLVGNFPQAFSHIGLVNSARHLSGLVARGSAREETGTADREGTR